MNAQSGSSEYIEDNNPGLLEYSTEEGRLGIVGFWIFIAAEVALFGTLFATYLVLLNRTAGGPTPHDLFEMKTTLIETFILLTSSFTCGLAVHQMRSRHLKGLIILLAITALLGLSFVGMEMKDFIGYATEKDATVSTSAFLSGFSVLVGTHGAHVSFGIVWMLMIIVQLVRFGLNGLTAKKVFIVGLYWHFLDVIWIFIFTTVFLTGLVIGK